ncbi:MAG: LexA family protein [Aridibacter sp.]
MQPRTKRQREILTFITRFIEEHGYEPSYQQIANNLGVNSKGGIAKHIEALERQGLILRNHENGSFNLELHPQSFISDHICEIEWLENSQPKKNSAVSERLYVPKFMLGHLSALNVRALMIDDNALVDEHICEEDIALIELKSFARDGECVAALVENRHIILRYFQRMGANVNLAPASENYETFTYSADKVVILGIYRGLIRPWF